MADRYKPTPPPTMHLSWPAPSFYGLNPDKFPSWRPGQLEAISAAIDAPTRFTALVLPTGFGKSMVYMALQAMKHEKIGVLTATRALQNQLERDFSDLGTFVSVKGQQNYLCTALEPGGEHYSQFGHHHQTMVDQAPCHLGVECSLKNSGCEYFGTVRAGQHADILTTNYAWWLTLQKQPHLHVRPSWLVLDEAHDAPDALADAIGSTLQGDLVGRVLNTKLPRAADLEPAQWVMWCRDWENKLTARLEGTAPRTREAVMSIRRGQLLLRALNRVAQMPPELIVHRDELDGVRFDLVWAAGYADQWLFRGIQQVVLTSATMTRHTAELLGIIDKDLTFYEAGDGFPVKRRPVYIAPAKANLWDEKGLRVDHRITLDQQLSLVEHIDKIIDARLDRKGIIHSVSYQRRDLLLAHSRHAKRMLVHDKRNTADTIAAFKSAGPGAVLVSPSVTTGYDFPYSDCEYQILMKIPFPDARDPIVAARSIVDTRYPNHVAMQTLVQTCGRPMRAEDDQAETFICDAHAIWFLSKNADLAPRWFRKAITRLNAGTVPTPPRPLAPQTR